MIKYIKEILIVVLLLWISGKYIFDKPETVTETVTDTLTVQIEVPIEVEPEIKWYPKPVKDTVGLAELNFLIDSLQQELNNTAGDSGLGTYVAEWDTTVVDESGKPIVEAELTALSRIPFDPALKFQGKLTLHNKTITETTQVYHGQSFWERFSVGINISAGYGIFTRTWDVYAGVGINYDIEDIF